MQRFAVVHMMLLSGLTVFSGLRHAGFAQGDKVAVIGLGGLGHMGVLLVPAMGGRVTVLSTSADKEDEALELGAERFINLKMESPSEALRTWEGGADIILGTAPAAEPMMAAFPGLALNGTMVVLGAPPDNIAVSPMELIMGRGRLMGSPAGSRKDLHNTLHLAATHGVRPRVTPMPLGDAGKALKQMHERNIHGRVVLVMD
jgi:alcohol dehydrogenase, propanol-preferring